MASLELLQRGIEKVTLAEINKQSYNDWDKTKMLKFWLIATFQLYNNTTQLTCDKQMWDFLETDFVIVGHVDVLLNGLL